MIPSCTGDGIGDPLGAVGTVWAGVVVVPGRLVGPGAVAVGGTDVGAGGVTGGSSPTPLFTSTQYVTPATTPPEQPKPTDGLYTTNWSTDRPQASAMVAQVSVSDATAVNVQICGRAAAGRAPARATSAARE